jgi:hypothetical protein
MEEIETKTITETKKRQIRIFMKCPNCGKELDYVSVRRYNPETKRLETLVLGYKFCSTCQKFFQVKVVEV